VAERARAIGGWAFGTPAEVSLHGGTKNFLTGLMVKDEKKSSMRIASQFTRTDCLAVQFSVLINPLHRPLQGKIVACIFSRESFTELILMGWETGPLNFGFLMRQSILGMQVPLFSH